VELRANRADRGNTIRCQLTGEYLRYLFTERVRDTRAAGHAIRHHLGTADDHHQQFVATDQRDRRPRGIYGRPGQQSLAVPWVTADIRG
jgi:hypothetical protein